MDSVTAVRDEAHHPLSGGRFGALRNLFRAGFHTPFFLVTHLVGLRSVHRRLVTVTQFSEAPPSSALGCGVQGERFQSVGDGVGPMVMRRYETPLAAGADIGIELMETFRRSPNRITATSIAAFMRGDEPATSMVVGDQLLVELAGPWNGPVEVIETTDSAVVMATLDGHMEAGLIRFDVATSENGREHTFRITSWARAGDPTFRFLHLTVPIGREIQTAMWVAMCRKAAALTGSVERDVFVQTEVCEGSAA